MKLRSDRVKLWPIRRGDIAPLIDVHEHVPDEVETTAQQLHSQRHRAGTAKVCGECRELAAAWRRSSTAPARLVDDLTDTGAAAKAKQLGRDYGRASATIHALRGEAALLRERIAELDDTLADEQRLVVELQQALDDRRPALDPAVLGEQLRAVWLRTTATNRPAAASWAAVAATAIDAVRGLWPLHPQTSPGGGEGAEEPPASSTGAPAPGDTTVALAAHAEDVLGALAQALAAHDEQRTGLAWGRMRPGLREAYRGLADAVVLAGWRPPVIWEQPDRRGAVARVLTDHELLADDTCRCGWTGCSCDSDRCALKSPVFHAEHVAEQLLAVGVLP